MVTNRKKITAFQGLRGYGIVLIFLSHYTFAMNTAGVNNTTWFGALGVEIFIVLSGYLLMEVHYNKPIELKPYLIKKFKKFYPLHFITLIAALPFNMKALAALTSSKYIALAANLTLTQAWFPESSIYFSYNGVAWYLSITIFFALISPVIVKMWNALDCREIIGILIAIIIAEVLLCVICQHTPFGHWIIYVFPISRTLDFMLGGGIWKLVQEKKDEKERSKILSIISLMILLILLGNSFTQNSEWYSTVVWTAPVGILIYAIGIDPQSIICSKVFCVRGVVWIGEISFEIFLIHQLVMSYVGRLFKLSVIIGFVLDIVITVIGALIWRWIMSKVSPARERY